MDILQLLGGPVVEIDLDGLNDGQADAMNKLVAWLDDPEDSRKAVLRGAAGTGKSYLTARFLKYASDKVGLTQIQATSTTHKATGVLRGFLNNNGLESIDTGTIHSYLKLAPKADGSVKKLKRSSRNCPEHRKLLVVDECSMMAQDLYNYLDEDYGVYFHKVLFIGDKLQLNPVGGDTKGASPTFDSEVDAELTEPVRQAVGNPIIELGNHLRDCILNSQIPALETKIADGKGVVMVPAAKWERLLRETSSTIEALEYPDTCRAVAWRNKTVKNLNRMVQVHIHQDQYPDEPVPKYNIGDTMVTYQPILQKALGTIKVLANNCEELIVRGIDVGNHPLYPLYECDIITLENDKGRTLQAYCVVDEDVDDLQIEIKQLARKKQWKKMYDLKERFDLIEPAYCLTSHKSQGSSFQSVFVDAEDMEIVTKMNLPKEGGGMMSAKDKLDTYLRCLYVGVTRASERVYIKTN